MFSKMPRRETLSTATQMPTPNMAAPASCNEEEEDRGKHCVILQFNDAINSFACGNMTEVGEGAFIIFP